jgi:hypothetical protein
MNGLHLDPLGIACAYCHAQAGADCVTSTGDKAITCHAARAKDALQLALNARSAT